MMVKQLFFIVALILGAFFLVYLGHFWYLDCTNFFSGCEVFPAYGFHLLFSLTLCIVFVFLAKKQRFADQLGFIYLFALGLKLLLYVAIFKESVLAESENSVLEPLHFLPAVGVGLCCEIVVLSKILKNIARKS